MSSDGLQKGAEDPSPPVNNTPSWKFGLKFGSQGNSKSSPVRFSGLGMPLFGRREKSEGLGTSHHYSQQGDVAPHSSRVLGSNGTLGAPSNLDATSIGSKVYGLDVSKYRIQALSHSSPVRSLSQQPLSPDNNGNKVDGGGDDAVVVGGRSGAQFVSNSDDDDDDDAKTDTSSAVTESQHGIGLTASNVTELEAEREEREENGKLLDDRPGPQTQSIPVQKQTTLFVASSSDQGEETERTNSGDELEDNLQTGAMKGGDKTLEPSEATVTEASITPLLESHIPSITPKNLVTIARDTTEISANSIPETIPKQNSLLSSPLRDLHHRNDQHEGTRNKVSKKKSLGFKDNTANYEAKIAKLEQQISHYEKNDAFLKRSLRMVINDVMDQETRVASLYGKIKDQNETNCQVRRTQELLLNNSLLVESACSTISRAAEEGRMLIKEYGEMKVVKSGEEGISFKVLNGKNRSHTPRYTIDSPSDYSSDDEEIGPLASAASRATWRRNNKKFQGTVRKLQAEIGNLKNQLGSLGNNRGDSKSEGLGSSPSYKTERVANILRQLLRALDDRIADYSTRDITLTEKIAELSQLQSSAGTKSLFEESDYVKSLKERMLRYNSEVKTLRALLENRTNNMKILLLQRDKKCSQLQDELNSAAAKLNEVKESERNASSRLNSVVNTAEHQRKSIINIVEQFKSVAAKLQSSENAVKNLEGVVQAQAEYIRNLQKFVGERSAMLKPERRMAPPAAPSIALPVVPVNQYTAPESGNGNSNNAAAITTTNTNTSTTTSPDNGNPSVLLPPGFNRFPTAYNPNVPGPESRN